MESSKIYTMPKAYWLLPVIMTGLALYTFVQPGTMFTRLLIALVCVAVWYFMLTLPQRVEITADGQVRLEGVLTQTRLNLTDISAVEFHGRRIVIRHRGGKITVSNLIHGYAQLPRELHRRNPAIVVKEGALVQLARSPQKIALVVIGVVLLTLIIAALAITVPAVGQFF